MLRFTSALLLLLMGGSGAPALEVRRIVCAGAPAAGNPAQSTIDARGGAKQHEKLRITRQ